VGLLFEELQAGYKEALIFFFYPLDCCNLSVNRHFRSYNDSLTLFVRCKDICSKPLFADIDRYGLMNAVVGRLIKYIFDCARIIEPLAPFASADFVWHIVPVFNEVDQAC